METNAPHRFIRRILVALDGSPHSHAALEAAASLAHLLDAELLGVFVEDINLIRLAQLPFATEVRRHAARPARLDITRMQRELRLQADRARDALRASARRYQLACSFRVTRGPVSAELLAASFEADLLALGRVSKTAARGARLGSTAQTAVAQAQRTLLLMRPGVDLRQPVLVMYDGTAGAARALSVASHLAQESGRLQVLIWAPDDETAAAFQQAVQAQLPPTLSVEPRRLRQADIPNLGYLLRLSGSGLLVLSDTDSRLPPDVTQTLLQKLDHPILLIRAAPHDAV